MLAIVAAVLFVIALVLEIAGVGLPVLTPMVLLLAGLACLSLHQGGIGTRSIGGRRTRR